MENHKGVNATVYRLVSSFWLEGRICLSARNEAPTKTKTKQSKTKILDPPLKPKRADFCFFLVFPEMNKHNDFEIEVTEFISVCVQ